MNLSQVSELIASHRGSLLDDLRVGSLSVFGSTARGDCGEASDIDILVDFEGAADFERFMTLQERLEGLLGARVDLVTRKGLRPSLRPAIEKEAVRVA